MRVIPLADSTILKDVVQESFILHFQRKYFVYFGGEKTDNLKWDNDE